MAAGAHKMKPDIKKATTKDKWQNMVCHKDCHNKKQWSREMPYIVESNNFQTQINTVLACLSCVHFVGFNNYIKEV